jgi:hypothetical protein
MFLIVKLIRGKRFRQRVKSTLDFGGKPRYRPLSPSNHPDLPANSHGKHPHPGAAA